jgi:signal transduction histidine kinase
MLNLGPPLRFPGAGPGFGGPPGKLPLDFRPPGLEIFRPPGLEMLTLRGEFAAAWRRPDEKWAIVEPEPDLEWIRRAIVWVGGGLLIMGPIGFWFAQRISAPLRGFAASAETLGRDPQASPIAPSGPAEIGVAARAFNAMQTRLQRYVADRVSMIGAISHDLRTPLTRIRFKLEKVEPALRTAVLSDVRQMEHMIDGVIAFNQDHATPSVRQRLDLVSLVISTADEAATGGADVCATFAPPLVVDGDAVGLQRLFANLIDNAVKYGARVEVFFAERDGAAVVTIIDDGPGLPQRELERVFTPFYRTEAARQEQSTGVGLGLSIARAVARSHGGDVVLRSGARGLIAEVVLPRAVG